MILGRIAAPGSELVTQRWLCERSAFRELLEVDYEAMGVMQLYRAADLLMRQRTAQEAALCARQRAVRTRLVKYLNGRQLKPPAVLLAPA